VSSVTRALACLAVSLIILLALLPSPPAMPAPTHGVIPTMSTPFPDQLPGPPIRDVGLKTLKSMVTASTYSQLGFQSVAEAKFAMLGVPAPRYFVQLLSLQQFTFSTDPRTLIFDSKATVYPVNVGPSVRSSIGFVQRGFVWQAELFGYPHFINAMDKARHDDMAATNTPVDVYFLVDVPAMQRSFLAVNTANTPNGLFLIPIRNEPGFTEGVRLPARTVFMKLAPLARQMGSSPPPS
jgi:hypothetical protein